MGRQALIVLGPPPTQRQVLSLRLLAEAAPYSSRASISGSVGSYFWSLGTGVGGLAQLPLPCKALPLWAPSSRWSLPRMREPCHRHGPGPLPTTSHRLLARAAPGCSGLSTGHLETLGQRPARQAPGPWPRCEAVPKPRAARVPGFSPSGHCSGPGSLSSSPARLPTCGMSSGSGWLSLSLLPLYKTGLMGVPALVLSSPQSKT